MTILNHSRERPKHQQGELRFGILGAAKIAALALIWPTRLVPGTSVRAVAARDVQRAKRFAHKFGIPVVHDSYAELLADPNIDAIYNPLPNSLHCEWTIRALQSGKHVLCEKPLAANAQESLRLLQAEQNSQRVLMEAFHYRYHPLATRIKQIVDSGELGRMQHIEAHLNTNVLNPLDIRFSYELGGGALMDTGSDTVNLIRFLSGAEPTVVSAHARCIKPNVDRWMEADFQFSDGRTGRITCSLLSPVIFRWLVIVQGDRGSMRVVNPIRPYRWHKIVVRHQDGTQRNETVPRDETTFTYQLRAFAEVVHGQRPNITNAADAVANLRVIDAIYQKAGLDIRGSVDKGLDVQDSKLARFS